MPQGREFCDNLPCDVLNKSIAPIEAKRVVLALLAKDCELKVNSILVQETITEEGEMKDGK